MRLLAISGILFALAFSVGGCRDKKGRGDATESTKTTPERRFYLAARYGDMKALESLIARYPVDTRDEHGFTALHHAAAFGQTKAMAFLISKGAGVNAEDHNGRTPLDYADTSEAAELLIASGATVDPHALYRQSAMFFKKDVVEVLLAHGAEITTGNTEENAELLAFAARSEMRDLVAGLLDAGADPNAEDLFDGMSVLSRAVRENDTETVELLISHGADVNRMDIDRRTPLDYATYLSKEAAELLLANGANVNARAGGVTPLHLAVQRDDKVIVELFLKHGADVNARTADGLTPLDDAIAYDHKDIAEILRAHGGRQGVEANF